MRVVSDQNPCPSSKRRLRALGVERGFTLIEMLVVVVIIGILASVVVLNIGGETENARITTARADIRNFETALEIYRLNNGHYPTTEQGLEALVTRPGGHPQPRNWKTGGYIRDLPADPWGHPYQYLHPGSHGEIDIYSFGGDGQRGGQGTGADIGNWSES